MGSHRGKENQRWVRGGGGKGKTFEKPTYRLKGKGSCVGLNEAQVLVKKKTKIAPAPGEKKKRESTEGGWK